MKVNEVQSLGNDIRAEIAKAVVGQESTDELMLVALFAGGHILLEGPPGTAKTLLAHSFAQSVGHLSRPVAYDQVAAVCFRDLWRLNGPARDG